MDGTGAAGSVSLLLLSLAGSTVRLAAPLVLAALAGLYPSARGSSMSASRARCSLPPSPATPLFSWHCCMELLAIAAGGDQIVSGMALNLIAAGTTPSLASAWFGQRGTTPPLPNGARFGPIACPSPSR